MTSPRDWDAAGRQYRARVEGAPDAASARAAIRAPDHGPIDAFLLTQEVSGNDMTALKTLIEVLDLGVSALVDYGPISFQDRALGLEVRDGLVGLGLLRRKASRDKAA